VTDPTAHTDPSAKPTGRWHWAVAAALLCAHAWLAIDTLCQKAVTVDEVGHLPAGISYWQKGTFELYHHNPPLVKLLAALPALATRPEVDYSRSWDKNRQRNLPLSPWNFGWEFMYANAASYHEIYSWARLAVVGLSLLAGLFVFLWARDLFGPAAGLVALALWTFCPNALAHGGLVTTDMGASAIGFVATYVFWKYLRNPTWPRASAAGAMLGIAQLTKFSLLLLYLLWPVLWLCWRFRAAVRNRPELAPASGRGPHNKHSDVSKQPRPEAGANTLARGAVQSWTAWRELVQLAAMLLISLFLINAGYLLEGTFTPLGRFTFLSKLLTRPREAGFPPPPNVADHPWRSVLLARQNRFVGTLLAGLPVPLPRHYVEGFDEQKLETEGIEGQGYPVYLCGELRRTGWWWYYFFALAVKVPLGTWLISAAALATALWRPDARAHWADELVLLVPVAAVLVVMSFLTDINLGVRYVLPIFPYWFVLVSRVAVWFEPRRLLAASAVLLPLVWNVAACARVHAHHLAYFNELAGGYKGGHRYLLDSNLDWGQDLLELARWLREHRAGVPVGLAYFGNVDPSILAASGQGFEFRVAPPRRLIDLELVSMHDNARLRAAVEAWLERHREQVEAWAQQHRQPLWHMTAFREFLAHELDLREGPQPGLFAVSANLLHGIPFRLRDHEGDLWDFARLPDAASSDAYGYFRMLEPIATIGGSILIYELSPAEANPLRAKLGLPAWEPRTAPPAPASTEADSAPQG
jgi:hypothetical protein